MSQDSCRLSEFWALIYSWGMLWCITQTLPESLFSPEKELKTYSDLENLKINVSLAPRTLKRTFVRVNVQEKLKKIQGDWT